MMDEAQLRKMIEDAAEEGAKRAIERAGLGSPEDAQELKGLLDSWRNVKKTVVQTTVRMITTALLGAIFLGIAVQLKLFQGTPGGSE